MNKKKDTDSIGQNYLHFCNEAQGQANRQIQIMLVALRNAIQVYLMLTEAQHVRKIDLENSMNSVLHSQKMKV